MTPAIATAARRSAGLLLGTAILACAGVAAQPGYPPQPGYGPRPAYAGGVTVYGYHHRGYHRLPDGDPELSRRVSYADLDLSTQRGLDELHRRIDRTAEGLCARLGEPEETAQNTAVLPSCQAAARDSAYQQVQAAVDAAQYRAAYGPPPGYGYAQQPYPAQPYPAQPYPAQSYAPAYGASAYAGQGYGAPPAYQPGYGPPAYGPPAYGPPAYYGSPPRGAYRGYDPGY